MKTFLIVLFILISQPAYSEVRIFIDTTGWTNTQRVLIPAIAYKIAFQNGENIVPEKGKVVGEIWEIIFSNLSPEAKAQIETTILREINTDYAKNEADRLAENTKREQAKIGLDNKLKALGLTDEEINALKGE